LTASLYLLTIALSCPDLARLPLAIFI